MCILKEGRRIKSIARTIITAFMIMLFGISAKAYNVIDLPKSMSFDEAFGIFSASEIKRATISSYADRKYVELTREQINSLFENMRAMVLTRATNPMPFRGIALNLYTSDNKAKSYYVNSGIELGLYGSSNYITYAAQGSDAVYMTNIETIYHDASVKLAGDQLFRSTANDFLKLPSQTWAHTAIKEAAARNLLPYEFTNKYDSNISREEFSIMLANLICVVGNYATLEDYMAQKNIAYLDNYFTDCEGRDNSINMLYALNIVSGRGTDTFDPDGAITREEAAALLCRTAEKFMYIEATSPLNFTDNNHISYWAGYFVRWASEKNIMNGNEGRFEPKESYTVLQAAATINRLYKVIDAAM